MFKYLKKYWYFAVLAPMFMTIEVLMDLMQPRLMGKIVDDGVLGLSNGNVGDIHLIITTGILMVGCALLGGVGGVVSGVFANLCSQNFGNDIRKDAFKKIMSLSFGQTDKFTTGSLITRVTNDVTQLQNMVTQCVRGFVRTFLLFAGGIVSMLFLNLSFGVIVACAMPLVLLCVIFFLSKVNPKFTILQERLDGVNNVMQENVSGARVVKAYVREDYEQERFSNANSALVGTQLDVLLLLSYMTPIMNVILNVTIVIIIKAGQIQVQAGAATPGNVMAAITYTTQILNAVMRTSMIFQTISRGTASARRINEVLECEPAISDPQIEKIPADTEGKGKIEFRNVSFAYPNMRNERVLENINLTINPGETFAILGATGCGKSSLVNLIPRLYDVTEGSVLVDGIDVRDYKVEGLREKVAIALQKSEIFSTSIEENIRWGKSDATDAEVENAAQAAQAWEFISTRPAGMKTQVSQGGHSLSGGQKQRLAISRALVKNAEILIFDDSTSALDLKTEAKLYAALKKDYKDVTKIIIAQRIASVKDADRIAVLDGGRIVACGSHLELMESNGIYRDIYYSQLKDSPEMEAKNG